MIGASVGYAGIAPPPPQNLTPRAIHVGLLYVVSYRLLFPLRRSILLDSIEATVNPSLIFFPRIQLKSEILLSAVFYDYDFVPSSALRIIDLIRVDISSR